MGSINGRRPSSPQNMPRANGRKPSAPTPPPGNRSACCSYQEAGRALLRRRYRLAARYICMDVKARLGVI